MLGAKNGKGGFFPKGIQGRINTPVGFDELADATEDWTGKAEASQARGPCHCSARPRCQLVLDMAAMHCSQ